MHYSQKYALLVHAAVNVKYPMSTFHNVNLRLQQYFEHNWYMQQFWQDLLDQMSAVSHELMMHLSWPGLS